MKKVFIYAGLPKTASALMRQEIFSKLDPSLYCVNPPGLTEIMIEADKCGYQQENKEHLKAAIDKELAAIEQDSVLFWHFPLAGDIYSGFAGHERAIEFVSSVFERATIIIVLRYQPDWLLSLYKHHAVVEPVFIDEFLNYKKGKFQNKAHAEFTNIDSLAIDYGRLCNSLVRGFGSENVKIIFYEGLKADPSSFVSEVKDIFEDGAIGEVSLRRENRGFSAAVLMLSVLRRRLFPGKKNPQEKSSLFVEWRRRFRKKLSEMDMSKELWKDAIRQKGWACAPFIILNRILLRLDWVRFVKNGLDRLVYINWDLLGKLKRKQLATHYSQINKGLLPFIRNDLVARKYIGNE